MSHRSMALRIPPVAFALAAVGIGLVLAEFPVAHADEETILALTFDDKKVGDDLTAEWRFFAEGSETTPGLTPAQVKRQGARFVVQADPKDPTNKVLCLTGGDTLLDDSFIYVPSLTDAGINKGDYSAIQLDFFADPQLKKLGPKKILKRAGPYRIGVFGFIDPADKASYGAWMRWSDRQVRVGRLVGGQEEAKRSIKLGLRNDCGRWFTIRADFQRKGDQLEILGSLWDRSKPTTRRVTEANTVALSAKKDFAVGIYQYTCSEKFNYDVRCIDNVKVLKTK